ncbi:dol-P-Man:Man(7)GlcNAc(2)-PP-Dol alpha-1,6-mannosyltransferase isoform X2 [Cryptomeria japonica]|uniref:dol-P-Man:Man(7)GlcNAc(2)-PP-Dol alpha-1,6-mannosyltransferase isoform X2 n=1 Tax=Cryptomeria japonica TaxID=3369 RepID=UPI0027D9D5F7|nr:dol-P-Man:Man(7)GlcNAc(2)-PP-Dol alpha-1,6-mannosyltransferase isoform X2 [Cryptomeria japonica]
MVKASSIWSRLDVLLIAIAAIHVFLAPYTKVEESFNVQAMHDILYHHRHLEKYDHFEYPGVVPRTFIGAFAVSLLASPFVAVIKASKLPKLYGLLIVRLVLGSIVLASLHHFRMQVRRKFGEQVSCFFAIMTALQFHLLFYCTRPLPNIFSLAIVIMAYAFWINGQQFATLNCLVFATIVFRCDTVLLLGPIGLQLLLTRQITLWGAIRCCAVTSLLSIGFTVFVDSIMWKRFLWPEMEVLWFNSVLNRSSEWGVFPVHWYFTSALPRSLLVAFPLCFVGIIFERRMQQYVLPILAFIVLYSKLPHKELRFIISAIPMLNLSAAVAATRIWNNRRKSFWKWAYIAMIGSLLASLGFSITMSVASYANYPAGYALNALHNKDLHPNTSYTRVVHIDTYAAMNGISRFCEKEFPWRYSKEEDLSFEEIIGRNFTYLITEHQRIPSFQCLLAISGFSRPTIQLSFPPVVLITQPKVFVHGNIHSKVVKEMQWLGCPSQRRL